MDSTIETAPLETVTSPTLRYVGPFALFMLVLLVVGHSSVPPSLLTPLWFLAFVPVCIALWPRELSTRPKHLIGSIAVGIGVFVLWIAPEAVVPGYRSLPLFSNAVVGHVHSSLPATALRSPWVLFWRTARAALIVPVVEELFWRGWMMRWLVNPRFECVKLGSYVPFAFWVTAILFASEHGPYWDVGLLCGIVYNLWMIRTKSVADCILMHGVTNLALSLYVIASGQWQYWQ